MPVSELEDPLILENIYLAGAGTALAIIGGKLNRNLTNGILTKQSLFNQIEKKPCTK